MTKKRTIFSLLLAVVMCFTIFGGTVAQAAEIETPSASVAASAEDKQVTQLAVQPRSKIGNTFGGSLEAAMPYVTSFYFNKNYTEIECVYTTVRTSGSGTAAYLVTFKNDKGKIVKQTSLVADGKSRSIDIGGIQKGTYTITISYDSGSTSARFAFGMDFYG